jgi:ferredoxin
MLLLSEQVPDRMRSNRNVTVDHLATGPLPLPCMRGRCSGCRTYILHTEHPKALISLEYDHMLPAKVLISILGCVRLWQQCSIRMYLVLHSLCALS